MQSTGSATEALHQSEQRFSAIFGGAPLPMALSAMPSGEIVDVNDAFVALFGHTRVEAIGKTALELGLLDRSWVRDSVVAEAARTGTIRDREVDLICKSGDRRCCLLSATVVTCAGGPHFLAVMQDISELKRAEKALRESEQLHREIVETADEGIAIHAPDGTITYVNQRMAVMLGYPVEELLGRSSLAFVDDEERESVTETRERLRVQGSVSRERKLRRKDGSILWTQANLVPRRDATGRFLGYLAMHTDITARKAAEERERKEYRETAAANRMLAAFVKHEDDELFDEVLAVITEAMASRHGVFGYIPEPGHLICPSLSKMLETCEVEGKCIHYPLEKWKGLWARALTERRSLFTNVPPPVPAGHLTIDNNLAAPILFRGQAIGLLNLANKDGGYSEEDRQMLDGLAARMAPVLFAWIQRKLREEERRQAQELLRISDESLRRAQEIAHLGSWELDLAADRLTWSDEVYRIFGLQQQFSSATYEAFLERVHPDDRAAVDAVYSGSVREGRDSYEIEHRVVRNDTREIRHVHERCRHERDSQGRIVRSLGMVLDITERKRAEAQLAADLEALTRMHALSGRVVGASAFEHLLQETMDTAVALVHADKGTLQLLEGDTLRIVAHHGHERGFLDFFAAAENVASACGEATRSGERVVVPDVEASPLFTGTPSLPVLRVAGVRAVQSTPMLTRAGRLLGILTTHWSAPHTPDEHNLWRLDLLARQAADIIEQVQAEERLTDTNLQLAEADRRKNEFLAVLSHELRNPLAPIANSLYILDHAQPGGDQAERAKQVIGRQVSQLSNLVDDLLDITRITRNKVQLQKERLELNELVRRAIEDNRSLFERASVQLEFSPATRTAPVIADRTRIAQIVGNLLQNSAKFTTKGGHTRVSVAVEGHEVVVRVADDGVGIARETLDRLFQPFMQAEQALDRSKGGLGLGLALVKGLVELHGGTVAAYSEGLGHGAEMIVRLPLDTGVALEAAATSAYGVRARRRVLIIEDNADAADSLSEALGFGDHEVVIAYSGPEGIAKALEFSPDVVLCDIGLPGMDGYEVARAFRAHEMLRGAFLVALSGYALPEDLQRAADAGFERHIAKPPSLEMLQELLSAAPRASSSDGTVTAAPPTAWRGVVV